MYPNILYKSSISDILLVIVNLKLTFSIKINFKLIQLNSIIIFNYNGP